MLVKENENIQVHMLKIEIEKTGHITNTYLLKDKGTNRLVITDPAYDGKKILEEIVKIGGEIDCVIITHSHADHIAGLSSIVNNTQIKVYIHELDEKGLYDSTYNEESTVKTKVEAPINTNIILVNDNYKIQIGNTLLEIMHTPGHTQGSIVLYSKGENILFSGDTIFENTYGRTDLIASTPEKMKETLDRIFNGFTNIQVFPGHGEIFDIEKAKRRIRLLFAFKERN